MPSLKDLARQTLSIRAHGSGVYTVVSSPKEKHTVDLRAFSLNGSCTCQTFEGCCRPLLSMTDKRWRCQHIEAVRDWVMDNEYWDLVDRTEKIIELPAHANSLSDFGL